MTYKKILKICLGFLIVYHVLLLVAGILHILEMKLLSDILLIVSILCMGVIAVSLYFSSPLNGAIYRPSATNENMFQFREIVCFLLAMWLPLPLIAQSIGVDWVNHSVKLIWLNIAVLGFLALFEFFYFNKIIAYFINEE